jgi:hypothetical protein
MPNTGLGPSWCLSALIKDGLIEAMPRPLYAPSDAFCYDAKGINFCISWLIIVLVQPWMLLPYSFPNAMSLIIKTSLESGQLAASHSA